MLTLKRILDVAISAIALTALLPVLLLLAVAVRRGSPGPVLFRQSRLGLRGRPFQLLKFRTMQHNCPPLRNADGSAYTGADDPRITPLGHFLRRTSLDELPQLINVLRGEMSLVGPRPDQTDQLQYYSAREYDKLLVKPGLTGLAQLNGRNSIPWERRKELDVEYVRNQSIWLDVQILALTVPYVLRAKDIASPVVDIASPVVPNRTLELKVTVRK